MTKFICEDCGKSIRFEVGMVACPVCSSVISKAQLDQLQRESSEEEATAKDDIDVTIKADPFEDDDEIDAGDSSKTAMAADMGYVDNPVHLKTMATPEEAYESATKSSAIPIRSVSEDDANGELRDYKIESKIDEGSFGFVYRAVQVPLDRYVAIKLLKPLPLPPSTESDQSKEVREMAELKVREEFLREAQFTGKLEHPNIVPIHDIGIVKSGKQSDRPFYVMKEIKGISWQDVFAEKSRDENTEIFKRVVDAVGFAHNNSILHCDLKPENVMLGEFGEVLVVDWGQAIDPSRPETYRPGGTPAYCSPEMAQYWCDFGQNPEGAQHSKRQIGPRSDVYLLGAILFQIVTGKTPHFGKKKETPADVMVRASRNEIRRHDAYVNDELMQIALRALRVADDEINTVAQIKEALEIYEERKRSIEIRDRAFELLEEAKSRSDYDVYQKAKFGFEESLELWEDNQTAKNGLQKTRLSCAQMALNDENFDLGLGMLEGADSAEEVQLRTELATGKRQRDSRKKMIRILSIAYVATLLIGIPALLGAGFFAIQETAKAAEAEERKVEAEAAASQAEDKVKEADKKLAVANQDAQWAEWVSIGNEILAEQANEEAQQSLVKVQEAEQDVLDSELLNQWSQFELEVAQLDVAAAQDDVADLEKQKKEAENLTKIAKEASRNLRYKNQVAAIEQKLAQGDYESARKLLDQNFGDQTSTYEWRRLNLLAHPEVTSNSRFPENDPLSDATLSADRKTVMLRFDDRIEIYAATDLTNPVTQIPVARDEDGSFTGVAMSPDGSQLAIAESVNEQGRVQGKVRIVDTKNGEQVDTLDAQSKGISHLEFSKDGNKLLSVGEPFATRRSTGGERPHELMVWERTGEGWPLLDSPKMYGNPIYLSQAHFSNDGRRIVTSNPSGETDRQYVYVLELRDNGNERRYHWKLGEERFDSRNPQQINPGQELKSGFVASRFADDAGNTVISSFSTGTNHQLVIWDVDAPIQTVPVAFTSTTGLDSVVSNVKYPSFEDAQRLPVDSKVNALDFNGRILLAVNDKKELLVWKNQSSDSVVQVSGQPEIYRGHGQPIQYVGILESGLNSMPRLVSIAAGDKPEIIITDLENYQNELVEMDINVGQLGGSPYSIAKSRDASRLAVGTDNGVISISDSMDTSREPRLSWQVAAWSKHRFTDDYLFALSSRDVLYKYNLQTGELESIESRLSQILTEQPNLDLQIEKIEFSQNGQFAMLQRGNRKKEIEVWNLAAGSKTIISYAEKDGLKKNDVLQHLAISSDGQFIAAGRIRFNVWKNDGTDLGFGGIESRKDPFNCLRFFGGSSTIVLGAENQIRTFEVQPATVQKGNYLLEDLPDAVGQANVVDARLVDGQLLAIIRQAKLNDADDSRGLALVRLDGDAVTRIADFVGAEQGRITSDGGVLTLRRGAEGNVARWAPGGELMEQSITVEDLHSNGRPPTSRSIFSSIHLTTTDDIALSWVSGGKQNAVTVTPDGQRSRLLVLATPTVDAVRLSDSQAVTVENGTVRKWDLGREDDRAVRPAGSIDGRYLHFIMNRNGSRALAADTDGVQIIDINSGSKIVAVPLEADQLVCGAWSADSSKLVVGLNDGSVLEWFNNQLIPLDLELPNVAIERICYSEDASAIVCIQTVDNVGVANILRQTQDEAGTERWIATQLAFPDRDPIVAADISSDGTRVVTGSARGKVTLWLADSDAQSVAGADASERELMTLHLCPSAVRDVRFGDGEKYILAIEENAPNSAATLIPAS